MAYSRVRRAVSWLTLASLTLILLGLGTVAVIHPAAAASALATIAANVSCATTGTTPCQTVTNTSSGIGFSGVSSSGLGVRGTSTSGIGVKGTTIASNDYGVFGEAYPGSSSNDSGIGTGGYSEYGVGVAGTSSSADSAAVAGTSQNGLALSGYSVNSSGLSVRGGPSAGTAAQIIAAGTTSDGLTIFLSPGAGGSALHVYANSSGTGVGEPQGVGNVLVGENYTFNTGQVMENEIISVDGHGNEILAGTLTQNGNPLVRTSTVTGQKFETFANRGASPTLEDDGEAALVNGQGYVRLNAAFASAIDTTTKYLVFVTPQGENKGLYATALSARGFAVRENAPGRSNVIFDYRVVAKPYDMKPQYMPAITPLHDLQSRPASKLRLIATKLKTQMIERLR